MHILSTVGTRAAVLVASGWAVAAWLAPVLHTAPGGAQAPTAIQREMLAQRPLVRAASILKEAVDVGSDAGYAGIVLEATGVALWWKGPLSLRMEAMVREARRIAPVRVAAASYSLDELEAAAAAIRAQLGPDAPIHAIKNPGDGSRLVVAARPSADGARGASAIAQWLPKSTVATEVVFEEPLRPISRNDDAPPWSGGASIVNTRGFGCTSGFGVIANGRPAVLTAGHCALAVGDTFQDGSGQFIGTVSQKTNHDQLIIPAASAGNRMYVGNRQSNTTKLVTGWEDVFVNELLCQSGVTSAQATGSEVCRIRVLFFYMDEESLVEGEQIDGQTGARPGDSGGPLYSDLGNTVIAKGTMTRVAGARVGFQDITTANQDFGGIQIPGAGPGPTPTPGPGPASVQLYQHCDFGGWQANFNAVGAVSTAQLVAAGGVNNDASSIRIAPGFRVTLFNGNNQTGRSVTLTATNSCLVGLNFNDIVSSMRIERTGGGGGSVVFFQDINFGGAQGQALAAGNYTQADLAARGVSNDWASSARIPAGTTVTMFSNDGFTGTSWTLTGDTANFVTLSPNANDQMSSVRVQ